MDERTAALCARFKMLLATAEWDTYEDEVRAMREREVATLLTSTKDQFDYRKGLIDGIDRTLNLPLTYLATLEDPDGQLRRLR